MKIRPLNRIKQWIAMATLVVVAGILVVVNISICLDKGHRDNMEDIASFIVQFRDAKGRFPASLAELEQSGFAPIRSRAYASPVKHWRIFWLPEVPLSQAEFNIEFTPKYVTISYNAADAQIGKWLVEDGNMKFLQREIGLGEHSVDQR
jgi:hypothetical protein